MIYFVNWQWMHKSDVPAASVDWLVSLLLEVIPLAAAEQRGVEKQIARERAKATTRWCDES